MSGGDLELEKRIAELSQRLRQEGARSETDLKQLYEWIGLSMRQRYGPVCDHNPCSVESISSTVLKMAETIPPCRILDVGMGGYPLIDVELMKRGFDVTGLEYSFSLSSLAREVSRSLGHEVRCAVGDGMKIPFGDSAFQACLCSETVEHVSDDRAVIREIHRILKPGGRMIFTVPCALAALGFLGRWRHFTTSRSWIQHPTHLREYTFFSAKKLLDGYFTIERWYSVPFTLRSFRQMPYEKSLSLLVSLPLLRHFSVSLAFLLKRRDAAPVP